MSATAIIALIEEFGPGAIQLVTTLIKLVENKGAVTSAQWDALTASLGKTSNDLMLARLAAAGIDPTSAQGKALLGLT